MGIFLIKNAVLGEPIRKKSPIFSHKTFYLFVVAEMFLEVNLFLETSSFLKISWVRAWLTTMVG